MHVLKYASSSEQDKVICSYTVFSSQWTVEIIYIHITTADHCFIFLPDFSDNTCSEKELIYHRECNTSEVYWQVLFL